MPTGRKSEAVRERVALLLAAGRTQKRAAAAAGVSERTVGLWLKEPAYAARVRQLRAGLFGRAVGRLCRLGGKAAGVLGKLLDDPSAAVRLGACRTVLEAAQRGREAVDVAEELEQLRAAVEGLKHGDGGGAGGGGAAAGGPGGPDAPGGPAAGGPEGGPGPDPGGDDARPLAGGPATLPFAADVAPLFEAGR
jgi:hypothetical protein